MSDFVGQSQGSQYFNQPQMNEFESDESKNLTAGPAGQEGNNTIVKVQLIKPHPTIRIRNSSTFRSEFTTVKVQLIKQPHPNN